MAPFCWQPPSEDHINGVLLGFKVRYRELSYDRLRSLTARSANDPPPGGADLTGEPLFLPTLKVGHLASKGKLEKCVLPNLSSKFPIWRRRRCLLGCKYQNEFTIDDSFPGQFGPIPDDIGLDHRFSSAAILAFAGENAQIWPDCWDSTLGFAMVNAEGLETFWVV